MKLSIIVPHFNEENNLEIFCKNFIDKNLIENYEIVFVDDYSTDKTKILTNKLHKSYQNFIFLNNNETKGLGGAIRTGIKNSTGDLIAIMMCDSSDSVEDLQNYYDLSIDGNYDAILGSRFIEGSKIFNYPKKKLILNRVFNYLVKILFLSDYNDFTNAFKIYKKKTLISIFPLVSENFNIFLEMPLKIIYRNFNYKIISISWSNKRIGESNFKIRELGSKYFFTLLYCFFEKILIVGNKKK